MNIPKYSKLFTQIVRETSVTHHVWKYGRHPISDSWEQLRKRKRKRRKRRQKPQLQNIMACPLLRAAIIIAVRY